MEVTAVEFEPRRGRRRWLAGSRVLSVRAALFLAFSMFLCGCVTAGLLFVGVWRHTATEQARAQAAQHSDRQQLLAARQAVLTARRTLTELEAQLARDRRLIAETHARAVRSETALAQATKVDHALVNSFSPDLQELIHAAATLATQNDTIQSELSALETYVLRPGGSGLDAGYLATQIRYLARSAAAAYSAALDLARHTREAQSTFTAATRSASR